MQPIPQPPPESPLLPFPPGSDQPSPAGREKRQGDGLPEVQAADVRNPFSAKSHSAPLSLVIPRMRLAVIDVGTNSVKLLVAEAQAGRVTPLIERSEQTRLGSGFYETHRLQPSAIARTADAVAGYAAMARAAGAESVRVIATSAARDALNAGDLVAAIRAAAGLEPRIIAGEQEADWAYGGVRSDPSLAGHPLLILDIGGGSTEFILGAGEHPRFRHSFPIGTVRLMERLPHADPPTDADWRRCRAAIREFLDAEVAPAIEPKLRAFADPHIQWVATGGSTTILARIELGLDRYDRARLEAVRLSHVRMREHRRRLWSLPLAERKRVPGLPASRADVILLGVAICEGLMDRFEVAELRISTRGLRFGALLAG